MLSIQILPELIIGLCAFALIARLTGWYDIVGRVSAATSYRNFVFLMQWHISGTTVSTGVVMRFKDRVPFLYGKCSWQVAYASAPYLLMALVNRWVKSAALFGLLAGTGLILGPILLHVQTSFVGLLATSIYRIPIGNAVSFYSLNNIFPSFSIVNLGISLPSFFAFLSLIIALLFLVSDLVAWATQSLCVMSVHTATMIALPKIGFVIPEPRIRMTRFTQPLSVMGSDIASFAHSFRHVNSPIRISRIISLLAMRVK